MKNRNYLIFAMLFVLMAVNLKAQNTDTGYEQVYQRFGVAQSTVNMQNNTSLQIQKAQTIGYSVGGKSGTAYKQIGKGYGSTGNRKYRSWFVGMAPIENPRVVIAVMIDEPTAGQYYGGVVAAPVFSEVVQQTLRMMAVQPDMAVKPQIVAAVEESF